MQLLDGELVLSATDLVGFLACEHLTHADRQVALGLLEPPVRVDAHLDMLAARGAAHEARTLARLRAGRTCAEIGGDTSTRTGLLDAEAQTLAAMRAGVDLVYQASFLDGRWRGHADFLLRVARPSALGGWSYEVADAKLAHSVKPKARTQLLEYSLHVARLQGRMPELMHVALGDGSWEPFAATDDEIEEHIAARARLEEAVAGRGRDPYPEPVEHCEVCRWADVCRERRRADDHLSLLPAMWTERRRAITGAGITTVAALAATAAEAPDGIPAEQWERHRLDARLNLAEREGGRPVFALLERVPAAGLDRLPRASAGDLFLDMESEPFAIPGGLEYLFGIVDTLDGRPRYRAWWAHDRAAEKVAFEAVVDVVLARLEQEPAMHVYHYASYEVAALRRLAERHGTRGEEVERLVSTGVLVDLYRIVKESLRISRASYSLKSLEDFYMPPRDDAVSSAGGSMVAYDAWRRSGDASLLEGIRIYNERDCLSTLRLRDWLDERRNGSRPDAGGRATGDPAAPG